MEDAPPLAPTKMVLEPRGRRRLISESAGISSSEEEGGSSVLCR